MFLELSMKCIFHWLTSKPMLICFSLILIGSLFINLHNFNAFIQTSIICITNIIIGSFILSGMIICWYKRIENVRKQIGELHKLLDKE